MPPSSYAGFLLVALVPPIAGLALATWRTERLPRSGPGIALLAALAVAYTTPWDNYLIARGVWSYGPGVVAARISRAPLGEYAFFVLQTVLVGLWFYRLAPARSAALLGDARRDGGEPSTPADCGSCVSAAGDTAAGSTGVLATVRSALVPSRVVGVLGWFAVALVGGWLLTTARGFYLGAILAWAAPVLALQWAVGGPVLLAHRRLLARCVVFPTLYLGLIDRLAIALGLWTIAPHHATGLALGGLPIEEALFFALTTLLVVQGLLLFHWVLARAREGDLGGSRDASRRAAGSRDGGVSGRWR
jgi:lycopene cyclase domain-containing protein